MATLNVALHGRSLKDFPMEVREKIYDLAVERNDDGSVPAILIALAGDKDYAFVLSRYHTVNFAATFYNDEAFKKLPMKQVWKIKNFRLEYTEDVLDFERFNCIPNLRGNKVRLWNYIRTIVVICSKGVKLSHTAFHYAVNGLLCASRVGVERLVFITEEDKVYKSIEDAQTIGEDSEETLLVGILADGEKDMGSIVLEGSKRIQTFSGGIITKLDTIKAKDL